MRGNWAWWAAALGLAVVVGLSILFNSDSSFFDSRTKGIPPAGPSDFATREPGIAKAAPTPLDARRATTLQPTDGGLVLWPGAASAVEAINRPDASARDDIEAVKTVFENYQSVFGEVPEGGLNEEITRGLLGDNSKKIVFLAEKPGLLDGTGALLDRWGTPYFFHKLSRKVIDLRSAGPDRKLWTQDDVFEATAQGPPL